MSATEQKPVSIVQMASNLAQTAEITTWTNDSTDTNERWRCVLRFYSTEPGRDAEFRITHLLPTQESAIQHMITTYNNFVAYFEEEYMLALSALTLSIDDPGQQDAIPQIKLQQRMGLAAQKNSPWFGTLSLATPRGTTGVNIHVTSRTSSQDVTERMNALYADIVRYVNQQFVARLARLKKFLNATEFTAPNV